MAERSMKVTMSADLGTMPADLDRLADAYDRVALSATKAGKAGDSLATLIKTSRGVGTEAERAAPKVGKLGTALATVDRQSAGLDRIGGGLTRLGLAAGVGLGAVTMAAMDWESAWAGVTKTVDGSPEQMASLERELRSLAKTLPATHAEIAGVAEAAGQLGIKAEDVTEFTRTMIGLSETTNLTADEAATSLAQMMNVMGTAPEHVDRLASVLVGLGNSGASTEKQILDMGQRIAGAGEQLGLSEGQVLAYANALASVGIEAEAGGSAISTSFLRIEQAVRNGGAELDLIAKTAGVSAEEFRTAFQDDAAGALQTFITGLGGVQTEGGNVTAILKDLGITGIREADAIRRLAASGDLLGDSLAQQNSLWAENRAATEEAEKRYQTAASQVQMAWGSIYDSAIDAGAGILPVVADLATSVAGLASAFGDLSPEVQEFVVQGGAVVAAVGLLGGGALKAATDVAGLYTSVRDLRSEAGKTTPSLGRVAAAVGTVTVAVGAALVAWEGLDRAFGADQGRWEAENSAASLTTTLNQLGASGTQNLGDLNKLFQDASAGWGSTDLVFGVNDLGSAFDRLYNRTDWQKFSDAVIDWEVGGTELGYVNDAFAKLDQTLAQMDTEAAAAGFAQIEAVLRRKGATTEQLLELFPQYRDALLEQANAQGVTTTETGKAIDSAEVLVQWMGGEVPDALLRAAEASGQATGATVTLTTKQGELEAASQRLDDELNAVIDSLTILREGALSAERANLNWEESVDALTAAEGENRAELDANTEAGRRNRTAIIDALDAMNEKITADFKATNETKGLSAATKNASEDLAANKKRLEDAAVAAGYSREEVRKMLEQYTLTPDELATRINTPGMQSAQTEVDRLKGKIRELEDKQVDVKVNYRVESSGKVVIPGKGNIGTINKDGGYQVGPGTGTSDDILSWLSNGEYVIKASSVDKIGKHRFDHMNQTGTMPAFADGGQVGGTTRRDVDVMLRTSEAPDVDASVARYSRKLAATLTSAIVAALPKNVGGPDGVPMGSNQVTGLRGHRFTENFANRLRAVETAWGRLNITQGGFRPTTPYSGTSHAGDAVDIARPYNSRMISLLRAQGIAAWDRAGRGNWIDHVHGVPLPYAGKAGGSAVWQAQDYLRGGDGLAAGGTVHGPGGPTDDRILVRLSNGENVTNAYSTARSPMLLRDINYGRVSDRNYSAARPTAGPATQRIDIGEVIAHLDQEAVQRAVYEGARAGIQGSLRPMTRRDLAGMVAAGTDYLSRR